MVNCYENKHRHSAIDMAGVIFPHGITSVKAGCFGVIILCGASVLFVKWKRKHAIRQKANLAKEHLFSDIHRKLEELDQKNVIMCAVI